MTGRLPAPSIVAMADSAAATDAAGRTFSKKGAAALVNASADRLAGWSGMDTQCSEAASGAIFSRNSSARDWGEISEFS